MHPDRRSMHTPTPDPLEDEDDDQPDVKDPPVPPDQEDDVVPQRDPPDPGERPMIVSGLQEVTPPRLLRRHPS